MRSVRIALTGALLISGLVGCRNRVAEENRAMWDQNRELQSELDRRNAEMEALRRAEAQRAATPAPAPAPVAPPPAPVTPPPAPKPVAPIADLETTEDKSAGTVTVNLPGDVFFDPGAATIRQDARKSLDKVAAALKKDYSDKQVRVEGHTDSDPIRKSKWKSNQELSEARAKAVRDYLSNKGVAGSIDIVGHGADKPRGQDKSRNRRVEVVVLVDASAPNAPRPVAAPAPAPVDKPELNK